MTQKKEIIKLILARLETMPNYLEVHLGSFGTLSKKELIEHVKKQDKLGKIFTEMQMKYLRSLKEGI